jgi:hypothetical protein
VFLLKTLSLLFIPFNRILQFWELRKWNRKHCARKSNFFFSSWGALMHESISVLLFIPLHIILMSLELPLYYLLLVKSISNLQAQNLLPVKVRRGGGPVKAKWYFKCQGAHWFPREVCRAQFGSANNYWRPSMCQMLFWGWKHQNSEGTASFFEPGD